jgi:leader peptidase (prepilin peptidase) / N-methyltransferase
MIALVLLCGLVGLMIGSFLNVVIWRVPRGESVVRPPSACPSCGHEIRPRDNIPVLGWLLLRGRCRDCGHPISARYPLVELACAALFVVMALRFEAHAVLVAYLYLAAVGLALAMIDFDTKRLPDALTLPSYPVAAVLLGVAAVVDHEGDAALRALIGAVAMGALYFVLVLIYPAGMGLGDVKLAPVLGAYLGWISYGALAVGAFLGFLYGGLVGVLAMAVGKAGRKSKLPFGPFMLLGVLTAVLAGDRLVDLYTSATLG